MKNFTMAVIAVLTVTASHAAFAGGVQANQRLAGENYEYFQNKGAKDSGQTVAQNPDYKFEGKPEQRLAQDNAEYFKGKPSSGTPSAAANRAGYEFGGKPEQRLANRSAAYFNQK